jgi:hypothetical protein
MMAIAREHVAAAPGAGVHDQIHGARGPEPLSERELRAQQASERDKTHA